MSSSNQNTSIIYTLYQNIWMRNVGVFLMIAGIIAISIFLSDYYDTITLYEAVVAFGENLAAFFIVLAHNLLIVRPFLVKKKFLIFFIVSFSFITIIAFITNYYFNNITEVEPREHLNFWADFISNFFLCAFGTAIYFIHLWIVKDVIQVKKDLQRSEAELSLLKMHINPHFLFNSLNNLYGLALDNPHKVADHIYTLSQILRYQIDAIQKPLVTLNEEIIAIRSYREYELIKYTNLDFELDVGHVDYNQLIPPLLFLPLIENALKFSLESEKPMVSVRLNADMGKVTFTIMNNFDKKHRRSDSTNSGILFLKRRLEELNFNNELTLKEEHQLYIATLILWAK